MFTVTAAMLCKCITRAPPAPRVEWNGERNRVEQREKETEE